MIFQPQNYIRLQNVQYLINESWDLYKILNLSS